MRSDETRAVLMRILQSAALAGDLSSALERHVSPAVVVHMPNGEMGRGVRAAGFLAEGYVAIPDLALTLDGLMVEDDRAAVQFVMEGTHTGPFRDLPPTGFTLRQPLCAILRVQEGLVAEMWYYASPHARMVVGPGADGRG